MLTRRTLTRRTVTKWMLAGAVGVVSRSAQAAGKVVVYTSNDSNLNRFVFEAFTKETGIEVEPVEAGSGVVFRRVASERERPLGDIVWGVSRTLLRANKALLAPYAFEEQGRRAGDVPRCRRTVARHQRPSAGDPAEHQAHSGRCRAEELGRPAGSEMEGQDRLHRSGEFRLGLFQSHHAGAALGQQ